MRGLLFALLVLAGPAPADVFIWVDAEGLTHISDDLEAVPEDRRDALVSEGAELGAHWDDAWAEPLEPRHPRGQGRVARLLRGAVGDLQRGDRARARAALESVLKLEPGNAEAHFHLALLARQRGRLDEAAVHLEAFLAHAGDDLEPWRASARRRLDALTDERRLAAGGDSAPLELVAFESPHFDVRFDARLGEASPHFADTVLRYLEEARAYALGLLGVTPRDPTGVVLYGRAAYVRAHAHRFSFQTVGFFDGRIHVVSAAHPAGALRALLFHEYMHAVFRAHSGGDRPFWLNEGLAERAESASRRTRLLGRSELALLRARIQDGGWIPLARLSEGFAGLSDGDARLAYLEAAAAARWLERSTTAPQRARLLAALEQAPSTDAALRSVLALDEGGIDAAVRAHVLAEFAPAPAVGPGAADLPADAG